MAYSLYLQVSFGAARAGLSTVGFRLYNADGTANGARVTSGVQDLGDGDYGALVSIPDSFRGRITWDDGNGGQTVYASEPVNPETAEHADAKISSRPSAAAIRAELETSGGVLATINAKLGAFTASGVNTVLGFLRAMMRKGVTVPSDAGVTDFSPTTDSLEAIRDAVDAIDTGGGSSLTAADVWTHTPRSLTDKAGFSLATAPPTAAQVRAEMDSASTKLANLDATVSSRLAASAYAAPPALSAIRAEVDDALGDYDAPTAAEMNARTLPAVDYATATLQVAIAGYLDTEIAALVAAVTAIKAKTDSLAFTGSDVRATLDGETVAFSSVERTALASAILDLAGAINGKSPRGALEAILAAASGKSNGAGTGTERFRDPSDTKNVITATVDENGNRTAVVLNVS